MQPMVRKVGTKATVEINTGSISHYQKVIAMEATAYLPTDGDGLGITRMGLGPAMASSLSIPTSFP